MNFQKILDNVKNYLVGKFPGLNIEVRREADFVFFVIGDRNLFFSDEYAKACVKLETELLWTNGIYNVEFSYDSK